jgi:hypothetical protein
MAVREDAGCSEGPHLKSGGDGSLQVEEGKSAGLQRQ